MKLPLDFSCAVGCRTLAIFKGADFDFSFPVFRSCADRVAITSAAITFERVAHVTSKPAPWKTTRMAGGARV